MAPGGRMLIGLPGGSKDIICYNAHKIYGPVLYSHLFANWDQVWSEVKKLSDLPNDCSAEQPLHVLEKPKDLILGS